MSKYGLRRFFRDEEICPRCGDKRLKKYVRHLFALPNYPKKGEWLLSDCSCIKKSRDEDRSRREGLIINRSAHPLPPGLRNNTFASFRVSEFNREVYESCQTFARNFGRLEGGQGILLLGRSGTGKTHLACAIVNRLFSKHSVKFSHVPTLLERMRQTNVELQPLLSADLLVLDDVGSERITGWTMERLLIIIDGRFTGCRPTVFTTNFDTKDFEARMGMRIASRILGNNLHLFLQGPDWRLLRSNR